MTRPVPPDRPRRSLLFVPASRLDRLSKALNSGADGVIVDLEDAVPPAAKSKARQGLVDWMRQSPRTKRDGPELWVRLNAVDTRDGLLDLLAIQSEDLSVDGVLLAKTETRRDLEIVSEVIAAGKARPLIGGLVETVRGLRNATEISAYAPLTLLMFGGADLAGQLRVELGDRALDYARAELVRAGAGHGRDIIDMPCVHPRDEEAVNRETVAARSLGFTGKAAIHPSQVAVIHRVLYPSEDAVRRARLILAADRDAAGGVALVEGRMVDKPMVAMARQTLALAGESQ